jgi:hypothetical protein
MTVTPKEAEAALDALRRIGRDCAHKAATHNATSPVYRHESVDMPERLAVPTVFPDPDRSGDGP